MKELWLSLRFPQLSLDHHNQQQTETDQAVVIIEHHRVCQLSSAARSTGIETGMSLSSAMALCSELVSHSRDLDTESRLLRALAHWAYQFTPAVSVRSAQPQVAPSPHNQALSLEINGSLRLFGGLKALLQHIHHGLQQQQFFCISSLGHTPDSAWLLGFDDHFNVLDAEGQLKPTIDENNLQTGLFLERLNQLSLQHLPLPKKQRLQLNNLGLRSLNDLLQLPSASVNRRFGKTLTQQLDRLSGNACDLQWFIQPQQTFFAECHALDGLTTVDMLEPAIEKLLREFSQYLTSLHCQCLSFHWRFFHFDRHASSVFIELSSAQNQLPNFLKLTQLKLHQLSITSPIETVQLHSDGLLASEARSLPLFRELGQASQGDHLQLVDTLKARLGDESVYGLSTCEDHLPEHAQQLHSPTSVNLSPSPVAATESQCLLTASPLPLWLLPEPRPLRPNARRRFISGAQRIDSHWWQQPQQRAYVIADDGNGHQWVFYDAQSKRWFLHGIFG